MLAYKRERNVNLNTEIMDKKILSVMSRLTIAIEANKVLEKFSNYGMTINPEGRDLAEVGMDKISEHNELLADIANYYLSTKLAEVAQERDEKNRLRTQQQVNLLEERDERLALLFGVINGVAAHSIKQTEQGDDTGVLVMASTIGVLVPIILEELTYHRKLNNLD